MYLEKDKSVCYCKYYVEVDMLKRAFNKMRKCCHDQHYHFDCVIFHLTATNFEDGEIATTDNGEGKHTIGNCEDVVCHAPIEVCIKDLVPHPSISFA